MCHQFWALGEQAIAERYVVTPRSYSNNVFRYNCCSRLHGVVDVLRFWRCGIVPSGGGRKERGAGTLALRYLKVCKVQQC